MSRSYRTRNLNDVRPECGFGNDNISRSSEPTLWKRRLLGAQVQIEQRLRIGMVVIGYHKSYELGRHQNGRNADGTKHRQLSLKARVVKASRTLTILGC